MKEQFLSRKKLHKVKKGLHAKGSENDKTVSVRDKALQRERTVSEHSRSQRIVFFWTKKAEKVNGQFRAFQRLISERTVFKHANCSESEKTASKHQKGSQGERKVSDHSKGLQRERTVSEHSEGSKSERTGFEHEKGLSK